MVETRLRHLHAQSLFGVCTHIRCFLSCFFLKRQLPRSLGDDFRIETVETSALFDSLLHACQRMIAQQLQHAHEVATPSQAAVTRFQTITQLLETTRQLPAPIDVGVIDRGRTLLQCR